MGPDLSFLRRSGTEFERFSYDESRREHAFFRKVLSSPLRGRVRAASLGSRSQFQLGIARSVQSVALENRRHPATAMTVRMICRGFSAKRSRLSWPTRGHFAGLVVSFIQDFLFALLDRQK